MREAFTNPVSVELGNWKEDFLAKKNKFIQYKSVSYYFPTIYG